MHPALIDAHSLLHEHSEGARAQLEPLLATLEVVLPAHCPAWWLRRCDDGSSALELFGTGARMAFTIEENPADSGWHAVTLNPDHPSQLGVFASGFLDPRDASAWAGYLEPVLRLLGQSRECLVATRAPRLYDRLRRAANSLSARYYGAPVYLVGSALTDEDPRDLDVVVVVEEELFLAMYAGPGETYQTWIDGWSQAEPPAVWRRWARDGAKQGAMLTRILAHSVDFKVQALTETRNHTGKKAHRLDCALLADPEE